MPFFEIIATVIIALLLIRVGAHLWYKYPRYHQWLAVIYGVPVIAFILYWVVQPLETYLQRPARQISQEVVVSMDGMALEQNFSDLKKHNFLTRMKSSPYPGISVYNVSKKRMELTTNYADVDDKSLTVKAITHLCPTVHNPMRSPVLLNGISCADSEQTLINQYQKTPYRISCWAGKQNTGVFTKVRIYDFPELNLRYRIFNRRILSMQVASPDYLRKIDQGNWTSCPEDANKK